MLAGLFLAAAAVASVHCNAHPQYRAQPHTTRVTIASTGSGYSASAHVAFVLRVIRPAVVPANDLALRGHAAGHRYIAQQIVAGAGGSVMGFGRTRAAARSALASDIASLARDTNQSLLRQEQTYDRVTDDGTAQDQGPIYGFPGGADVTAFCAR
jgi:hypothetical protein